MTEGEERDGRMQSGANVRTATGADAPAAGRLLYNCRPISPFRPMKKFTPPYEIDYAERERGAVADALFYQRWSPRSFSGRELPEETLRVIFDAARWSPSSRNDQPWLFVTSSGASDFEVFLNLLTEGNQRWAHGASLLGFVFARKNFEHNDKPNATAAFDCGAAWMAMTLQARRLGLYTHGMGGIKRDEVCPTLGVDAEKYQVICGFALGEIAPPGRLDAELAAGEKPSPRKPLPEIWRRGPA